MKLFLMKLTTFILILMNPYLTRYPQYLASLIWTVSCRCLGCVVLDYLFACENIFLFTSAAGVNVPVSEHFKSTVFWMFFALEVRKSPAFRSSLGMAVLTLRGTAVLTLRLPATQLLSNFNPSERSLTEGTVPSTGRASLVARSLTQGTVPRNGLFLSRCPLGRRRRFLRVVSEHAAHGGCDAHVLF